MRHSKEHEQGMITREPTLRLILLSTLILILSLGVDGRVTRDNSTTSVYENATLALVWYQTSAECRALYYQAFNTARLALDVDLRTRAYPKKRAIVCDIDATILDDSPHSAMLLKQNKLFPYRYDEWIEAAREQPLPGALEFARYASSHGVELFYISNRTTRMLNATLRNLQSAGFPQADESHVLLMTGEASKESRRKTVAVRHEIVLLLGDNLNDLSNAFEGGTISNRSAQVDSARTQFGSRYIVLPNPVYGAWESAVYQYKSGLTEEQKDAWRKSVLKSFE